MFEIKTPGLEAIRELGRELERLHKLLNMPNVDEHVGSAGIEEALKQIGKLNTKLIDIAKRHNGFEY